MVSYISNQSNSTIINTEYNYTPFTFRRNLGSWFICRDIALLYGRHADGCSGVIMNLSWVGGGHTFCHTQNTIFSSTVVSGLYIIKTLGGRSIPFIPSFIMPLNYGWKDKLMLSDLCPMKTGHKFLLNVGGVYISNFIY